MTDQEHEILTNVISALKGDSGLVAELKPNLEALRLWLDTWVIAPLEIMNSKEPDRKYQMRTAVNLSKH